MEASSKVLDHLGLVSATANNLSLVSLIDECLPLSKNAKTTYGQRVLAMILNGLGFIDDRLYLFPKFLANKPVDKLLGPGLLAEDFNDDALGRALDAIFAYGPQKLFSHIALSIALKYNLIGKSVHLDTTTLSVYGTDYDNHLDSSLSSDAQVPFPTYGYAKNKRFDLKQMTLLLATTGSAHFPVWMEAHSGNASDSKTLDAAASRLQQFCKALKEVPDLLYVADASFYPKCVEQGDHLLWLTRVPSTIQDCKTLLHRSD
ncbi:IS1634 family transposase, partial [Cardinium endosymbiont of Culicoides punctatus]